MTKRRKVEELVTRNSIRVMLCLTVLLLALPVLEQSHVDDCEQNNCVVCATSICKVVAIDSADYSSTLSPACPDFQAQLFRSTSLDVTTVRSRGPPSI